MSLWVPQQDDRGEMVDREVARQLDTVKRLNYLLRDIDRNLEIVFIGDRAPETADIKPGRWHVRRNNEGAPDSYMPIVGPGGEYTEPHSGVFDDLHRMDLWRDENMRRVREQAAKDAKARESAAQAQRDELREEFRLRLKAKVNPSVRPGGSGWTARKQPLEG